MTDKIFAPPELMLTDEELKQFVAKAYELIGMLDDIAKTDKRLPGEARRGITACTPVLLMLCALVLKERFGDGPVLQ